MLTSLIKQKGKSLKKYKIVLCGSGSTYTPDMLELLITLQKSFPLEKVVLYDINSERQSIIGEYGKVLFKEYYPDVDFSYTTEKDKAFSDIDFAFVQIRAGGLSQRNYDEKIPYKYERIGQETCGAGGLAYGIRSVIQMTELVKDIREFSKNAWIINYSNPAAIVAEACKKLFPEDKKIVNICDMPTDVIGRYLPIIGKKRSDVDCIYVGLNHFGWFTQVLDKKTGEDLLPDLLKEIVNNYDKLYKQAKEKIRGQDDHWGIVFLHHLEMIKDFPYSMPNSYNLYYLYPELSYEHYSLERTRYDEVVEGRESKVYGYCRAVTSLGKMKGTEYDITHKINPSSNVTGDMNSETIYSDNDVHAVYLAELVLSIINNKNDLAMVMVKNDGIVSNLDPEMMLEATSIIGKQQIIPLKHGPIGQFEKGLLENQYASEKLLVEAIIERSDLKLLQAFTVNRLIGDANVAKKIINEFKEVNGEYWPSFK